MASAILFVMAVILSALLLFMMVYFIIMFSDLEVDYINPIDLCQKLNQYVLPEYGVHGVLTLAFLLNMEILPFLINTPLLGYNIYNYTQGKHHLDPTVIFRDLNKHKRDCFVKLGFFLLCFFYYLYRMILALISH
eukprot:comp24436_c0_seq1/m.46703 comp24436_c0_seq1/g.46703  ORF comp24436_c0_seq1/g.46703 comp24436_c0_seq1/m.46703 type:complete len:135 (-) comp24436_c0_seq1:418-822(-)